MSDEVTAKLVRAIAATAGVSLDLMNAERVAVVVSATRKRFSAEKIALPLEIEPATFAVVARQAVKQ
jgi:hypothetical protein